MAWRLLQLTNLVMCSVKFHIRTLGRNASLNISHNLVNKDQACAKLGLVIFLHSTHLFIFQKFGLAVSFDQSLCRFTIYKNAQNAHGTINFNGKGRVNPLKYCFTNTRTLQFGTETITKHVRL